MTVEEQIRWLQIGAEGCLDDERPLAAAKFEEIAETLRSQAAENATLKNRLKYVHDKVIDIRRACESEPVLGKHE